MRRIAIFLLFALASMAESVGAIALVVEGTVTRRAFEVGPGEGEGENYRLSLALPAEAPLDRANSEDWGLYTSGDATIVFSGGATGFLEDVNIWIYLGTFVGPGDGIVIRTNMHPDPQSSLSDQEYIFERLEFRFAYPSGTLPNDGFQNYSWLLNDTQTLSSELIVRWDIVRLGATSLNGDIARIELVPELSAGALVSISVLSFAARRKRPNQDAATKPKPDPELKSKGS